jgi:triacylglycerol lipase
MRVFLIHGMGRTPASFALLRHRLRRAGHDVRGFHYMVTRESLAEVAARFRARVLGDAGAARGARNVAGDVDVEPYAIVGHSLGNVITRLCLPLPGLCRFVMLAPPNRPPVLARALQRSRLLRPVFRALTQDAGDKLGDDDFYAGLPIPDVPSLVVAGNHGPRQRWLPFAGAASDGVVAVDETRLPGIPHVEVRALHTFLMNDARVARLVLDFLAHGEAHAAKDAVRAATPVR